ncbi:hypothetical protein TrST_g5389 [Triparma strigata]|uniref:Phosphodiesterase n=1 Tax=Triparma strigata TaxID=1606541 RepID=A0A9W7BTF7_9STRA|nr:hypothetical protein TrST_g5389 [Triparma strigata]
MLAKGGETDSPEREIPAALVDPAMISAEVSGAEQWGTRRNSREPSFNDPNSLQGRHRASSQGQTEGIVGANGKGKGNGSRRRDKTASLTISTKRILDIKEPLSGGTPGSGMSPIRPSLERKRSSRERSSSPDSAGGPNRPNRKLSISSRLNPISFERDEVDEILVDTTILDSIEPWEFVELMISSAQAQAEESNFAAGRSRSTGGSPTKKGLDVDLRNKFYKENFTNVVWELKACKQLLTVNSYMGNDLHQASIISKIMDSAHYILNCDRVSLYLVDHAASELTCVHSRDEIMNIKIPIGKGIVGEVAKTGRPLNIRDAYKDTRFYQGVDKQTGYRTKGVICFPIKFSDVGDRVEAVIQAINKNAPESSLRSNSSVSTTAEGARRKNSLDGTEFFSFTKADESMLSYLAAEAAMCLQNAKHLETTAKQASKNAMMAKLLQAFTTDLDTFKAIEKIVDCAADILDADRVSLFLKEKDELVCNVSKDVKGFRFPASRGIAGQVVQNGNVLNVIDAYDFAHFNPEVDQKSGYLTKSILCGPVRNSKGETIAVLQAVNKRNGDHFSKEDENLLVGISNQAGIGLQNAKLFDDEKYQRALNASLIEVATAVSSNLETHTMFQTIMNSARDLLGCDRCSLFLIDHDTEEFWSYVTESDGVEFRFPMSKGIIGQVAEDKNTLNIEDAYKFPSFNAEADAQSGYRTKSILCMPVVTAEGHMVAVIEMINKLDSERTKNNYIPFRSNDEDILTKFTSVIAGALSNSLVYNELEQHATMVESTLQGITSFIITLDKNGRLKTSNHPVEELFGTSETSMKSTSYMSWIKDSLKEGQGFKANIQKVYKTCEPLSVKNEKLFVQAKSGSSLMVNYQIMPLRVESKKRRYNRRNSSLMKDKGLLNEGSSMGGGNDSNFDTDSESGRSNSGRLSSPPSQSALGTSMDRQNSNASVSDDPQDTTLQGVVIVLENITEGRLRQSAIQRYQRRLNEMENQVKEFSELKDKLQSIEISDLQDITPEATREFAKLALCLNDTVSSSSNDKNKLGLNIRQTPLGSLDEDRGGLLVSGSPSTRGFLIEHRSVLSAKAIKSFSWDVLQIEDPEVLKKAVCVMFDELQVQEQWAIPNQKIVNLVENVAAKYRDVAFHNFKHGIAVAHMNFFFISSTDAGSCLNSIQAFALLVSALCHDLDHPGHTNAFEVNSNSELALFYNDTSVLENHHCATAAMLLRQDECNILVGLERDEFREFRSVMCNAILATDMSTHFNLLSKFRESVHTDGGWNPEQSSDKLLLLSVLLHAADLSNPCREWGASSEWSRLVSIEFNAQVVKEKEMGLPFLPFMQSDNEESKAKQEISFIEFIIEPMWKDVVEFLPQLDFCLENIAINKNNWREVANGSRHTSAYI